MKVPKWLNPDWIKWENLKNWDKEIEQLKGILWALMVLGTMILLAQIIPSTDNTGQPDTRGYYRHH